MRGMRIKLDHEDYSRADLSKSADPIRHSFTEASLVRTVASGTSFAGCDMRKASMWAIQAPAADFSGADLSEAPIEYFLVSHFSSFFPTSCWVA